MHSLWVAHALRLRLMWCTHCVWRAPLALFLLYRELFCNRELFTNREFRDARTSALPHVTHALCVVSSAYSFSIVLWTLFRHWNLFRPSTPWRTHSACSFSIVPWALFQSWTPWRTHSTCFFSIVPWALFQPWTPWCTHFLFKASNKKSSKTKKIWHLKNFLVKLLIFLISKRLELNL